MKTPPAEICGRNFIKGSERTHPLPQGGTDLILNVSNIEESCAWFEKLGWKKAWDWGEPQNFGGVREGECEIYDE